MIVTYETISIMCGDQHFIDELSDHLRVEYHDIKVDIAIAKYSEAYGDSITNQLIRGIYEKHITSLSIPDEYKERLMGRIHTNSVASSIDDNIDNYPEEYHNELSLIL